MRLLTCSNSAPQIRVDGRRLATSPGTPGGLVPILVTLLHELGGHWFFVAPSGAPPGSPVGGADRSGEDVTLHSVALDDHIRTQHHETISIRTLLWLFHYLHDTSVAPTFDSGIREPWAAYQAVNKTFAESLAAVHDNSAGEVVLVHDFHLMLVPAYLAALVPQRSSRLVYFHHVPWCAPDYFGILPAWMRTEILESLLRCDVVGFHCDRWAEAFIACCARFLPGVRIGGHQITYRDHSATVTAVPGPIDAGMLDALRAEPATERWRARLTERLGERRMITRVDRLDLWKNLVRGFAAYEAVLQRNPAFAADLWMCAIVTLPRRQTARHKRYQALCEDAVRRINERFGGRDVAGEPVTLLYPDGGDSPRSRAVAALELSAVTLVNPTYDGLNMVAKEAIVVNDHAPLLLSVNAGAYDQLASFATPVQPFDVESTADAIATAVHRDRALADPGLAACRAALGNESATAWLDALLGTPR